MSISQEISASFRQNDIIIKLIYINTAIFLIMRLLDLFALSNAQNIGWAISILGMPIGTDVIYKPWTIITNIFAHYDFIHFIFNMLCLYWFGKLFMSVFASERRALKAYIYGGLTGCIFSFLTNAFVSYGNSILLGASGSIMCLMVAAAVVSPDLPVWVTFFGEVRLKYLALAYVALSVIMLLGFSNIGGNLAHLGGALMGYFLAKHWLRTPEKDSSLRNPFRRRSRMKVVKGSGNADWDYNATKHADQKELDRILDKIKKVGYDNLSDAEKKTLFDMSKK